MGAWVRGFSMTGAGRLEPFERPAPQLERGWALVEVAGCGVCHTDLSFLYGGVPTKKRPPLVLGHEIAGRVVDAGSGAEHWLNRRVLVPAVSPCGACGSCRGGRPTSCASGRMPGNHLDGGFASHVAIPAATLCPIDGEAVVEGERVEGTELSLWQLSIIADAVTTPLQALRRAGVGPGDFVVVVGTGGVGIHAVQLARALGAQVAALDVDDQKLSRALRYGARAVLDARGDAGELKQALKAIAAQHGAPAEGWKIVEASGTPAGQRLAFFLLTRGGVLSVVGFSAEPVEVRLSSLMALDASAHGNWGCDPALYPAALQAVREGKVRLEGLLHREPLSRAPEVLEAVHHGAWLERVVLVP